MKDCKGFMNNEKGTLHVGVTNLSEFEKLVEQAKKQADELQNTIDQLRNFDLDIHLYCE